MRKVFTLHHDLFGSPPGQDAFARTGDRVAVLNFATISHSGTMMTSAIRLAGADARVANFGSVLTAGQLNTAITVGGDRFTIDNHGLLASTGQPSSGIRVTGSGGVVHNHGVITAGSRAVFIAGNENRVDNHGLIETAAPGAVTCQAMGNDNLTINHGAITALSATTGAFAFDGDNNVLINHGLIGNELGRGMRLSGGDNLVVNHGVIRAPGGTAILTVEAQSNQDTVENYGVIVGEVNLGRGDDRYVAGHGGSLEGRLILGEGHDTVVVRQNSGSIVIADFAVGPGSGDLLELGAFAGRDFAGLLALSTQQGNDIVIRGGPGTVVVLQNVLLTELSADDFRFAAATKAPLAVQTKSPVASDDDTRGVEVQLRISEVKAPRGALAAAVAASGVLATLPASATNLPDAIGDAGISAAAYHPSLPQSAAVFGAEEPSKDPASTAVGLIDDGPGTAEPVVAQRAPSVEPGLEADFGALRFRDAAATSVQSSDWDQNDHGHPASGLVSVMAQEMSALQSLEALLNAVARPPAADAFSAEPMGTDVSMILNDAFAASSIDALLDSLIGIDAVSPLRPSPMREESILVGMFDQGIGGLEVIAPVRLELTMFDDPAGQLAVASA